MDSNSYNDIVYSLYKLGNTGVNFQDSRYRQLLAALNGIRSRRNENVEEFTSLTGTGQNPFNSLQFSSLLNQIDAYVNYITKSLKVPASLLAKCNPDNLAEPSDSEHELGTEQSAELDAKSEAKSQESEQSQLSPVYNENELIEISDVFHRKNEFWGPGFFWLDYRDNLEQNKLSFFLGAITNVKTMTQYIIQNNSSILGGAGPAAKEHNAFVLEKFEQLFRDIGLHKYLLTFSTEKRRLRSRKRRRSSHVRRGHGSSRRSHGPNDSASVSSSSSFMDPNSHPDAADYANSAENPDNYSQDGLDEASAGSSQNDQDSFDDASASASDLPSDEYYESDDQQPLDYDQLDDYNFDLGYDSGYSEYQHGSSDQSEYRSEERSDSQAPDSDQLDYSQSDADDYSDSGGLGAKSEPDLGSDSAGFKSEQLDSEGTLRPADDKLVIKQYGAGADKSANRDQNHLIGVGHEHSHADGYSGPGDFDDPNQDQIIAKYDFERLLSEILRLEKKINLLLLQKNVKSILNLTRLTNPLYTGHLYSNESAKLEYKRNLMEHIKSSAHHARERLKLKRRFSLLASKLAHSRSLAHLADAERLSENLRLFIQRDRRSIYDSVLATLEATNRREPPVEGRINENVLPSLPACLVGKLRNYQLQGLGWLVSLYNNKLNGILADEMGLGKTIQTIALLIYLKENKGINGPHIVLAPMSTLHGNWKTEFEAWFPSCKLCVYEGSKEWRKSLRQKWYEGNKLTFDVLLTSDSFILKDRNYLKKVCWEYLIVDEAHRLKNPNSKLVKVLNQYFISNRRLLLTGTPLQNDLNELWALLNFIKPQIFNSDNYYYQLFSLSLSTIIRRYDDYFLFTEEEQLSIINNIHKILKPYLLRREKLDVLEEVPSNDEFIICCPMSGIQTRMYEFLVLKDSSQNRFLQLRKICNHPYLYANSHYPCDDMIISSCGKLCMLDLILSRLYHVNHRVLIFSQMTSMLDILEVYLSYRNYKYLRLDGSTTSEKRLERLNLFNKPNSEYFVFILSTKAGSLGINLQTADTVIIYDSDWNPQNDLQAQSRVHRIGQKNKVISLRLITPNTIEENILRSTGIKLNQNLLIIKSGKYHDPVYSSDDEDQLKNVLTLRNEYTGEYGIRCVEMLNKVLSRSDEDSVTFKYVGYKNFILNPFPLIKHRVLPPFLLRSISANKRFQLTDGDKLKLNVDRSTWANLCNDYNIYSKSPTPQCLVNYSANIASSKVSFEDPESGEADELKHIITNLPLDYPVEFLTQIEELSADVFRALLGPSAPDPTASDASDALEQQRQRALNAVIRDEVGGLIAGKRFPEFNELPHRAHLKDYYDKIKHPISLREILAYAEEARFCDLSEFRAKLQLLCANAKFYNGSESPLFHRSLNLSHVLASRVSFGALLALVRLSDASQAALIERLLASYFDPAG